jgi:hypothetical protein
MSHRTIITNALRTAVNDTSVQSEMSDGQKSRMSQMIPAEGGEIDVEDIDRVLNCVRRIYSKDD